MCIPSCIPPGLYTPSGLCTLPRLCTPQTTYPPWTTYPPRLRTPPGLHTPLPRGRSMCGRYASYWNAFLFIYFFCILGKKPHKCPVCGKKFGTEAYMKGHLLIHTGEAPHKCDYCGKVSASASREVQVGPIFSCSRILLPLVLRVNETSGSYIVWALTGFPPIGEIRDKF